MTTRLDEWIAMWDSPDVVEATICGADCRFLASVLRAGQELAAEAENLRRNYDLPDLEMLEHLADNYDTAVGGGDE